MIISQQTDQVYHESFDVITNWFQPLLLPWGVDQVARLS
jgi:hypothetical protein